jgi:hypothetical protein
MRMEIWWWNLICRFSAKAGMGRTGMQRHGRAVKEGDTSPVRVADVLC